MTQDKVAERVSKSRTAITNALRLLKLSEPVQQMLIDEMLTTGHVRALISIERSTSSDVPNSYAVATNSFISSTESNCTLVLSNPSNITNTL